MSTKFQSSLTFFLVAKEKDWYSRVYSGRGWRSRLSRPTFPCVSRQQLHLLLIGKTTTKKENKQTNKQTQQPSPWAVFLAHLCARSLGKGNLSRWSQSSGLTEPGTSTEYVGAPNDCFLWIICSQKKTKQILHRIFYCLRMAWNF